MQFDEHQEGLYFGEEPIDNRVGVSLQESERSLLDAATRILAARITASGQVSGPVGNDEIKESVSAAIKMAKLIDKTVRADKER
ncbi:hypothetical protein [Marinobacter sp. VGCF2001]|uniref:hypothetical protein n=1 Tax=Marinobacter sp. VGCF2001 TaxID=3417189 RepID=UPI003CF47052